jgi:hypothetical protein
MSSVLKQGKCDHPFAPIHLAIFYSQIKRDGETEASEANNTDDNDPDNAYNRFWSEIVAATWQYGESGGPNTTIQELLGMPARDFKAAYSAINRHRELVAKALKPKRTSR